MGSFESDLRILETELGVVAKAFGELTDEQWRAPTLLTPLDEKLPHWTVFELAGHFDISIGLTRMLVADNTAGQVGRDRTSFFIFPRSEVAPVVYAYAYTMVEGKTPGQMPGVLTETFTKTIEESRTAGADKVGSGYYALMRLDEFVASRIVEAVVHGLDLTDALGRPPMATPGGLPQPPRSSTSCWLAVRCPADRPTSPTTWPGSAPPPAGPTTRIPGFP